MKHKIYYIIGIFVIIIIALVVAIIWTSKGKGSVIDISVPSKEKAFIRSSSLILGPGTMQNLYFHKSGWFIKKIEFRMPDLTDTNYKIQALVTVKGEKPRIEDWSTVGKKIFCLDKRDERFNDVVLTVINDSASSTLKEEIQVFAMREGCNEWSGSVKYEWTDTKEKKNEQGILQAIFTLRENAYATEFVVADGGYAYNFLGCSQEEKTKTYTIIGDGNLGENTLRLEVKDDGTYLLKLPSAWGKADSAKEYLKRKSICIYGKESGDIVNDLEEQTIYTLPEVVAEKLVLTPDPISGNLKGKREISEILEDGTERKITISWDLVRQ
ncbi:MAG: hypothetical protein COU51_01030 [Parcubacteria group bacterium CG10_big_fil_rev_8_21_14_0_10_36_14]|nr:MAG: hypothetical protein COU51_01030 [Parcubacteria group bacterium CG10_big_fil_rev_8_21_14_0_10_36_14]